MRDNDVVERLQTVAHHDWKNSHPLDLSDKGLRADLEEREGGGAEKLALAAGDEHEKRRQLA